MNTDGRNVAQVLERELALLESGWYEPSAETCWKAPLVFQDSPTCPNFARQVAPHPCKECVLMQFVPSCHRDEAVPCRHIPLNNLGETVETLSRYGTPEKARTLLRNWLLDTIKRLKRKGSHYRPQNKVSQDTFRAPDAT
ncbi:MAG: hypothetical protein ABSD20_12920 [Terriglobales bacterium]|jgi:hypothetical protein